MKILDVAIAITPSAVRSTAMGFTTNSRQIKTGPVTSPPWVSRWCVIFGLILFAACILSLTCTQQASAFNQKAHYDISTDVLGPEGFSTDAIERIEVYNDMDDVATAAEDTSQAISLRPYIWVDCRPDSHEITANLDYNAHFQHYANYDQLNAEWNRLESQTYKATKQAVDSGDVRGLLAVIGMSMHTTQDFYAHSNWADLTAAGQFGGDATWFDVSDEAKIALSDTVYSDHTDEGHDINHNQLNKDYPGIHLGHPTYEIAYREGYYASVQWLEQIKYWVVEDLGHPEMWEAARAFTDETPGDPIWYDLMRVGWWSGKWADPYSEDQGQALEFFLTDRGIIPSPVVREDWAEWYEWIYGTYMDYARIVYDQYPEPVDHVSIHKPIPEVKWLKIEGRSIDSTSPVEDPIDGWLLDPQPADFFTTIIIHDNAHWQAPWEDNDDVYCYPYSIMLGSSTRIYGPCLWDIEPIPMNEDSVYIEYYVTDEDWGLAGDDDPVDICPVDGKSYWSGDLPVTQDYTTPTGEMVTTDGNGGGARAKVIFVWSTYMQDTINKPPTAEAGGPYEGSEGSSIDLTAAESTDPDNDPLQYHWDFTSDGVWDTEYSTSSTATYTPLDNGAITATVEVWDGELVATDTCEISIDNVVPTTEVGPDTTINEGSLFTYAGSFTDPGADTWTATVDYGDSGGAQALVLSDKTFQLSHIYADNKPGNAPYTVTVTVTDKDNGVGSDTCDVTVMNVAPTVIMGSLDQATPAFILPLSAVTLHGTFTDPGVDMWTYSWDFGDGTPTVCGSTTLVGLSQQHAYAASGDYTVKLTVTDDDGGSGYATMPIHVASLEEAMGILNQYIQSLPNTAFTGNAKQQKLAYKNMFSALGDMIADEEWTGYITSIQSNVRSKADGQVDGKTKDDWIKTKADQQYICTAIDTLVAYIRTLM